MAGGINTLDLGRRAKSLRQARGLTLEDVVSRTDFTVSWLSKLENGLLTPSLDGLVRLAEVLECGVDELVEGLLTRPRVVITRQGDGRLDGSRSGGSRNGKASGGVEHLCEQWRGRSMVSTVLHVRPGRGTPQPMCDVGERLLFVLEGCVQLDYGETSEKLSEGDAAYIDARVQHSLSSDSKRAARVLSVLSRHTEPSATTRRRRPSVAQRG
jgi:transcriptional regulator with XRE-family HTH domain